jgi:hypothetical protein
MLQGQAEKKKYRQNEWGGGGKRLRTVWNHKHAESGTWKNKVDTLKRILRLTARLQCLVCEGWIGENLSLKKLLEEWRIQQTGHWRYVMTICKKKTQYTNKYSWRNYCYHEIFQLSHNYYLIMKCTQWAKWMSEDYRRGDKFTRHTTGCIIIRSYRK